MRGDLLPFWEADGDLAIEARRAWFTAAERIASGLTELAHADAFVDVVRYRIGFSCTGDGVTAARYARTIRSENVEPRLGRDADAGPQAPLDEVYLPCHPDATGEEIKHVVLAVVKAIHVIEFGDEIPGVDAGDGFPVGLSCGVRLAQPPGVVAIETPWAVGRAAADRPAG